MAFNYKKFFVGLKIVPKTSTTSDSKGDLEVLDSTSKLSYHNGTSNSPVLTEAHSATVTNKLIDADDNTISDLEVDNLKAGVLNTSATLAGASDTQVPSALAAKIYADTVGSGGAAALAAHLADPTDAHDASAISVSAISGLTATDVQAALAEHQVEIENVVSDLAAHIIDATDAHDASAISNVPAGTIAAVNVQTAINELDSDIQGHITDAVDAHDASAISNIPSGNLSATEVQAALNELQSDIDTRISGAGAVTDEAVARFNGTGGTSLQNSLVTITDAGIMSGATQLNVDNLRLDGNTVSSTDTNGNIVLAPNGTGVVNTTKNATWDALVTYSSANDAASGANVTLTAPTTKVIRLTNASLTSIDGIPSGVSARELILKNATGTTVVINEDTGATAANRFYTGTTSGINLADKASLLLSYDATQSRWRVIGGSGSGTGSQTPDTFVQLVADELLTTWTSGNNASFLGGGVLAAAFVKETSSPLNGTASYKVTQAAGSLNDYIASAVQSVPVRFRGNTVTGTLAYTYNGGSSDIEPVIYDVTNSAKLTTSTNLLPSTGTNASIYKVNVTIPSTCTQIRVGFHVKILNSGKVLAFDDIQVSGDTTVYADPSTIAEWQSYTPTFTGFGAVSTQTFNWRRVGSSIQIQGKFTTGTVTAAEARVSLPNNYVSASSTVIPTLIHSGTYLRNSAGGNTTLHGGGILIEPSVTYFTFTQSLIFSNSTGNWTTKATANLDFTSADVVSIDCYIPIAGLSASNPQIITASESFSTDTASLVYASSSSYTLSTLSDAPVGTFITFAYTINSNTRTQTTTAPTQTTSDMNTNGIQFTARPYNAASTAAAPAALAIQIGKGFKGKTLDLYKAAAKATSMNIDWSGFNGTNTIYGFSQKEYNEATGILYLDAAYDPSSTSTGRQFLASDITVSTTGYLVINASKSPALVGVPQVQPRIATIKDVKAANTTSGTFTSGAFQTRTLNTLVDSTGIVTSLASNQFVLPSGTYYIEAQVPAYAVERHKLKLRNVTDSSDALIGHSAHSLNDNTHAFISGEVVITAAKTFEIQHRCQTTQATNGFGLESNFAVSEVYAVVKIQKVK